MKKIWILALMGVVGGALILYYRRQGKFKTKTGKKNKKSPGTHKRKKIRIQNHALKTAKANS